MTMWKNNLQKASYKNVAFDVISISDKNEKALVRHGRPFANGTDIEDLGTQGRQCQVAAVYFGAGFDTQLSQLLCARGTRCRHISSSGFRPVTKYDCRKLVISY
ncbi:DNA circularization N-terminal domain-containing protein [Snodgrassella gandavensis]|uniref:DNA circularization N-terminal domain-containing protein n=1 Tax=Snodgrassella gandavensis TaxID=2946698 RepID=UPI001EF6C5A8|nr:DNA circularization N-terminal domain-containing protein [Snodgrassella gandavensis]